MFHHLLRDHCNKTGKQRQLTEKVEKYLKEIWKEFEADKKIPFLQTFTSIPKAASTSCLKSTWKSNQTYLNKERFNRYVFDSKYCKGHIKPVPMEGLEHWDLADTVYCPCVARKKKIIQKMEDSTTICMMKQNLAIQPIPLFCKRHKQSIIQTRRTFFCSYLIPMERPESRSSYPFRTYPTGRPTTRSLLQNRDTLINQALPGQPDQPGQPNHQGQQGEQQQRPPGANALRGQMASKGSSAHKFQKGGGCRPKNIIASGMDLI
jgi:hypothetical protein